MMGVLIRDRGDHTDTQEETENRGRGWSHAATSLGRSPEPWEPDKAGGPSPRAFGGIATLRDTLIPAQGTDFGLRSLGLGENTFLWFNGPACSHLLWHTGQGPSGPRTPRTTNALARAPAAPLAAGTGGPERQTSAWVQEPLCGHGSCEQGQVPARRV